MLPAATERILALPDDALILDVGAWGAPFNRADWVLDVAPYETRGPMGHYGPDEERFTRDTWVIRDICDREPWPFEDDFFDFSICVTTLEDIRDPIWVSHELSRVSKAGYIEVPTVIAELIYNVMGDGPWLGHQHHRWFCDVDAERQEVTFWHKSHAIHPDWRLRVTPRMAARMSLDDHLQGMFWEGSFTAHERIVLEYDPEELRRRVREHFNVSDAELRLKEARDRVRHLGALAKRPARRLVERGLDRLRG